MPPRILYIEKPAFVGGSVISLYELVRGLDTARYEPVILFHGPNPYRQRFQALGVRVITLDERPPVVGPVSGQPRDIAARLRRYANWLAAGYRAAKETYLLARRDWPAALALARLIKAEAIDLVHQNNSLGGNQETVLAARLAGVPQVCHMRGMLPVSFPQRFLAGFVDRFIYISQAVEQYYRQQGIAAGAGQIVHDAYNAEAFRPVDDTAALRAEFGLTGPGWLVSNVGRLDWWKGHEYFLQAMAQVVRSQPGAKAVIVGEPDSTYLSQSYYRRLQQMVSDLQLQEHVIFAGFRPDVPRIMAASDVVVHSSSEPEPFGIVVIEAMAMGRPVVATAGGGVLDIIEDQVNGLLVPTKDAAAMAKAIQQLIQNPAQAGRLGRCAQQNVRTRFSAAQHVAAVQTIYQQILSR